MLVWRAPPGRGHFRRWHLEQPVLVTETYQVMIRVGIIGFGAMGRIRYEAVAQNSEARVLALAEPDQVGDIGGVKVCAKPEDVIENPEIDAVFICTPNYLNQSLTIQALRAGKHVFCEKPPAFNARGVELVMAAEQESGGCKLMYGFNHRHHESIVRAKEVIDSGRHGRLLWMRGRYGKSVDESFYKTWRAKKRLAGGGILIDQGIHMLDLFLMMAGDFDEVQAFVSTLYWKLEVEDNVFAILRNQAGVVASLHSTMTQWRHLFALEMFLEHGYVVVNGLLTASGSYGEEAMTVAKNRTTAPAAKWSDSEQIVFKVNNSWRREVDHFINAVKSDTAVQYGTSRDALKLMGLVDKIYRHPHTRRQD